MQEEAAIFFERLAGGSLWLQYCENCQKYVFYPRKLCPCCLQQDLPWKETSGLGKVYSYTIINYSNLPAKKEQTPYIYALVELMEEVRLAANITDCRPADVYIGMPVRLAVQEYEEGLLHCFRPVKAT